MKNKKVMIGSILVFSVLLLFLIVVSVMKSSKSIDISLEKNYEDIIYVSDKAEFLLVLKGEKVANILFLNKYASKSLANKKIEGKGIEEAVELIVDHLKNDNLLDDTSNMEVKSLKQSNSYPKIASSFNKNLVIYGINKEIVNGSFTLEAVLTKFHLEDKKEEANNIEMLYQYSKELIK